MNVIHTLKGNTISPSSQEVQGDRIRSQHRMTTWQAIQSEVLSRIRSGYWQAGELIPTETELAAEFGCARATINRALTTLAASGLLERRRKVGTRIALHPPSQSLLPRAGLRQEIEARGAVYSYQLIGMRKLVPSAAVSQKLMLAPDTQVVELLSVFSADDALYCCEERWINPNALPDLPAEEFEAISAFEWLSRNTTMNHGKMSVSGVVMASLPEFVFNAFQAARKEATLRVEQALWADSIAVTLSRHYYPEGHTLDMEI